MSESPKSSRQAKKARRELPLDDELSESDFPLLDDTYDGEDESTDITLTTSDLVEFKVHSGALIASSHKFRDIIKTIDKEDPVIRFKDEKIETSEIVRAFLDIIYGKPLAMYDRKYEDTVMVDLIKFVRKYEARTVHEVLRLNFKEWNFHKADKLRIFTLGANLDDQEVCYRYHQSRAPILA
ncbi:uncharacterized protein L201_007282 [Kwoniella dendrophila CBS 6074]|uniref:BTB domain-containing protein n=1 Tax=Kwoniella dendrophila CBS 6074 TaxID=1295534 RepID=A0AAX4K5H1_9TREE